MVYELIMGYLSQNLIPFKVFESTPNYIFNVLSHFLFIYNH